jgi:RHH-type proline utilization regulon transcriptional repressor/proline dehydrogenase/delta 1-pyrroline-5-carboxylate dehydrogenase
MNDKPTLEDLRSAIEQSARVSYVAAPLIGGKQRSGSSKPVRSPADQREVVGQVIEAASPTSRGHGRAQAAFPAWEGTPASERAPPPSTAPPT